jgi:phenylpropionate dioxygenase-like ring-hydroxylating dioxygenase large terminal subunit
MREYVDDRIADGVFRVHPDVFTDPELYALEQRHVFAKTWIFLGLETQLPKPNDYIVAHIGEVQVLVTRDKSGALGAFLNTCRHKGTLLCRTESGNRRYHVCPYHGWSYDAAGKLVDIKDRAAGGYSAAFERENHDLVRLPAFASCKGLMFGSLSADVPPLDAFLGDLRFFLDAAMEQGPHGMEFVPGRIAFTFDANWKAQMDNGTDFYHLTSTHTSFMEVQRRRADEASGNQAARQFDWKKRFAQEGGAFTFAHGHNAIWLNQAEVDKRPIHPQIPEVRARAGDALADWMLKLRNVTIFPSMQIADATSLNVRTFRPLSVNRTEMRYWCLAPIGEAPEVRAWRLRQFEDFFNVSGFATPDDAVTYEDLQLGLQARQVGWLQGYGRAMTALVPGASPLARDLGVKPTASVQGGFELQNEVSSHATYREWARLMDRGLRGLPAYDLAA